MTTLVKKYPVFEDNQVLTSSQLNNMFDYLDQQNRLTRVTLIGVGIACGLDITCETSEEGDTLTISKGIGVTSEGYLIKICTECITTRVRTYIKPQGVTYPPFEDPISGEQDVQLLELLTEDAETDPQDDIIQLEKEDVDDMAVLLFIECFDKDLKSCLGKSCDELGIDRFLNLRKLLISRSDLEKVLERTEGGYQDLDFPDQFSLPEVVVPRAIIKPDSPASEHYALYAAQYILSISAIYDDVISALKKSYEIYQPALQSLYSEHPFESNVFLEIEEAWIKYINAEEGNPLPLLGIQYFYDFIKDIILAYTAFKNSASDLMSLCCPDTDRFPKHLILGFLDQSDDQGTTTEARHGFTQPPIYGNQKDLMKQVRLLHQKIVLLIESFDLDRLNNPGQLDLETKITPSCEKKSLLYERSIPMYYNVDVESKLEISPTLEEVWRGGIKDKYGRSVLSYDRHLPFNIPKDPISTPLEYDLDAYDFLRIEGHVGKHISDVIPQLEFLRSDKNLEFDVRPVSLGNTGLELGYPECLYQDLQVDYSIWRHKTLHFFKTLLSMSTGLLKVYNKREALTKVFLEPFRSKPQGFIKPISVNPAKFSNLSDLQFDIDRDNWHFAGVQLINAIDNLNQALKAPNDEGDIFNGDLGENPTLPDYLSKYNDCLLKLIDNIAIDIKDFDFASWQKQYACMHEVHIDIMKRLAAEANNPKATVQAYVLLFFYCMLYDAKSFLSIHPYIAIGVLTDTLHFRKDHYQQTLELSNFLTAHPGAEHKSGVTPGGTLILLYLTEETEEIEIAEAFEKMLEESGVNAETNKLIQDLQDNIVAMSDSIKESQGLVIGDLTLQNACCDDCGDLINAVVILKPLSLPRCGVVTPDMEEDNQGNQSYFDQFRPLTMKTISHIYDTGVYRTQLSSDPKFGTAKFELVDSSFEFEIDDEKRGKAKKVEEMIYTVDTEAIAVFHKENPDVGIVVDEFNYEILGNDAQKQVVGQDKITIFIPIIERDFDHEVEVITISGRVLEGAAGQVISNAHVIIKSSQIPAVNTDDSGSFSMSDVPVGSHILVVSHPNFNTKEEPINVSAATPDVGTITLTRNQGRLPADVGFGSLFNSMNIDNGSLDAVRIQRFHTSNVAENKEGVARIRASATDEIRTVVSEVEAAINEFSDSDTLTIVRMNNQYGVQRDAILSSVDGASRTQMRTLNEALSLLTLSYLQRLSLLQPTEFSPTTITVLKETAELVNAQESIELKSNVEQWIENSKGNVHDSFGSNLQSDFILNR